jgi:Fur family transcriptional regulator, ferric uptake regulator
MSIADFANRAEELLRGTATRVTRGRVAVLAALLESRRALTHHEVETKLDRLHNIDRVTVYRVLEWLTDQGLAHRLSGDDRVWRFTAERQEHEGNHPHFKCSTCGDMICLHNGHAFPAINVPVGYRSDHVEITVKGQCPGCAARRRPGRTRKAATEKRTRT